MMANLSLIGHVVFLTIYIIVTKNIESLAVEIDPTAFRGSSETTIVIDEGESLSVTCSYESLNIISYPMDDPMTGISTSPYKVTCEKYYEEDTIWYALRRTFYRQTVVFGDTGWYSCTGPRFGPLGLMKRPKFSYYVYVKSKNHFFVSTKKNNTVTADIRSKQLSIPCRPTSPDLHVDLINVKTNTKVLLNNYNTYDPKLGFSLKLSPDLDGSVFKCEVENNSQVSEIFYHVKVGQFVYKNIVYIKNKEDYHFTVVGQTLHINCSYSVFTTNTRTVEATWVTPRNMNFRKVRRHENFGSKVTKITLELIVENVTINDTGMYSCRLNNLDQNYADSSVLFIEVHDAVEVTSMWEPMTKDDDIKLRCDSWIGNSTKSIEWIKENESIRENERISIENTIYNQTNLLLFSKRADLNIKQIRESDKGAYFCRVTNYDNSIKIVNYNITTIHEPMAPRFNNTNLNNNTITLIRPVQRAQTLSCKIIGMPPPSIAWYKDDQLLENATRGDQEWNGRFVTFLFDIHKDITGNYSCVGTNRMGQTDRQNIQIIAIDRIKPSFLWISIIVSTMFVIVIFMIYICFKIRAKKAKIRTLHEVGLVCLDETYSQSLHLHSNTDEQIKYQPYSEKWDIDIKNLKLGKHLGGGEFGVVLKAEAQNISDENSISTVSVKLVSKKADFIHLKSVVSELKMLMYVGKHLNLVNLLGVCTDKIVKKELLLILEYCCFGNVSEYLICNRKNFINEVDPRTGKIVAFVDHSVNLTSTFRNSTCCKSEQKNPPNLKNTEIAENVKPGWRSKYSGYYNINDIESIYTRDLLSWAYQIACAMDHLSSKKVVHGDLALENVLLTQNNVVKLCDIGVAKTLLADEKYKQSHEKNLPLKWMAIESINQARCSLQSDVWSFGVVLWELFTLAEIPYADTLTEQLYEKLLSGHRLEMPTYAIKEIYDTMLECWQEDPNTRPTFANLVEQSGVLLDEAVRLQIVRMTDSYSEKRVQFVSEEIHLNRMSSSLEFENAMTSGTDLDDSADYKVMETRL